MAVVPEVIQDSHYFAVLIFVPNEGGFEFNSGHDKKLVTPSYCWRYDIFRKTHQRTYNYAEHWGYTYHRSNAVRNVKAWFRRKRKKREKLLNL